MKIAPLPNDEAARLEALRLLKILDTPPEPAFDDLTRLAAYVCGTPIAAVSFVDAHRQWFKSSVGLEVSQTSRELAFCAHTILQPDLLIVADTLKDSRFAANPLVTGDPNIRFYAGAPLITADGYAIGTLFVIDRIPRELRSEQIEGLKALSRQVVMQLELRGNLDKLVSIITQLQDTALALRQSEERFRNLVETSSDWVWELDENFMCTYTSPKVYDLLGYKPEEVLGKTPFDFMPLEEARRVADVLAPTFASWQPYTCLENIHIHKDGHQVLLEFSGVPVFDQEGRFRGYRGMARDITERKQAEKALQQSEQRFRQLAENIHQVFWIGSIDGQPLYVSPAYEDIWGRTCESVFEQPSSFLDTIYPEDRSHVVEMIGQRQLQKCESEYEYRIIKPDGSIRWIRERTFPIRNEQGVVYRFAGIAEDITSRKQAEEDIRQALLKERELSDLKSRFITTTSHEFRTPLATISLSAGLLKNYGHKWSEEKKLTHFERIEVAVQRMTQLLEDVLFIGKAEAGKLQFNPVPLALEKFCRSLVEELQLSTLGKHEIILVSRCNCIHASMDEKLLRHILSNLLSNAIKYSPDSREVHLELSCQDEAVVFQIRDQGIGIPPEDQQRLFESFHRASNVGNISGTGLGLAIVKKCVDLHGGQITLESSVVGTTFTVTLPLNRST